MASLGEALKNLGNAIGSIFKGSSSSSNSSSSTTKSTKSK